jgi:hypothetical protein
VNKNFEKRLKLYKKILREDYIYWTSYENEEIPKINHVRIIIELLGQNPRGLFKENFSDEVERYERKKFGSYVRSRTCHQIRKTVRRLRENYEIVENLCKEYGQKR